MALAIEDQAILLQELERYADSIPLLEQARALYEVERGGDQMAVANTWANQGGALMGMGDDNLDAALLAYGSALAIYREQTGDDSIQIAQGMPKSGHMANSQGKVTAAAIVAQLSDLPVNPDPLLTNTCYSFVSDKLVVHVASVHQFDAKDKTYKTVAGSGGVSTAPNELEGVYALNWAQNIWADTLR